jgi:hypothetical protein
VRTARVGIILVKKLVKNDEMKTDFFSFSVSTELFLVIWFVPLSINEPNTHIGGWISDPQKFRRGGSPPRSSGSTTEPYDFSGVSSPFGSSCPSDISDFPLPQSDSNEIGKDCFLEKLIDGLKAERRLQRDDRIFDNRSGTFDLSGVDNAVDECLR